MINLFNREVPIWLMRQAGRYLPEYLEIRSQTSNFLEFCYNPELAAKVTLQPIKRFGFDAAIIFSDILVIPDALGVDVSFQKGHGPVLKDYKFEDLKYNQDILNPVYEAIKLVKKEFTPLIGFAGAPFTIATYMVEGGSSRDFQKTKIAIYEDRLDNLIEILKPSIATHLKQQIKSGVDIIQIFDSWAGVLNKEHYERYVIQPIKEIVEEIRREYNTPIIGFPRCGDYIEFAKKTGVDAVSVDQNADLEYLKNNIDLTIQGNLDPILLLCGGEKLDRRIDQILSTMKGHDFIFNLGHGILPQTPIKHVERLIEKVR